MPGVSTGGGPAAVGAVRGWWEHAVIVKKLGVRAWPPASRPPALPAGHHAYEAASSGGRAGPWRPSRCFGAAGLGIGVVLAHPRYAELPPHPGRALRPAGRWSDATPLEPSTAHSHQPHPVLPDRPTFLGTQSCRARRPAALLQDREKHNCETSSAARDGLLPDSAPMIRHDSKHNWRPVRGCRVPRDVCRTSAPTWPTRWLDQQLVRLAA